MISIHASAKEATCKDIKAGLISHISIHASAKEATRPRIGFEKLSAISIHASAKEATWCLCRFLVVLQFQSTPPRRRRLLWAKLLNNSPSFQSTPPRRRRHEVDGYTTYSADFNPRLREGGDGIQRHNRLEESKISIHASAKEATWLSILLTWAWLFQSTPPRRRRLLLLLVSTFPQDFNPRLREGGDMKWTNYAELRRWFQSTPPRRRRQISGQRC